MRFTVDAADESCLEKDSQATAGLNAQHCRFWEIRRETQILHCSEGLGEFVELYMTGYRWYILHDPPPLPQILSLTSRFVGSRYLGEKA